MTKFRAYLACAIFVAAHALVPIATAQSRLPATVSTSTFTLGQALGCVIRAQAYLEVSRLNLANAGSTLPPAYQNINQVIGLDVTALRADLEQALAGQAGPSYDAALQATMITEIVRLEYGSQLAGATLYSESWAQMGSCGYLYHVHGLYDAYSAAAP